MHFRHTGMVPYLDVWSFLDLVDQVLGHRAGKRIAADENHNAFRIFSEVHRGLASGVGTSDDVDNFPFARKSLSRPAAVIYASALQAIDSGSVQFSPLHTGCNHQSVTGDFAAIRQFNDAVWSLWSQTHYSLWSENLDAEPLGLRNRPASEVTSAQPDGKSEIVFNARTHARLSAGSFTFHNDGLQTLGRSVDSSCQARRTSAHNCQFVETGFGTSTQTHLLGDFRGRAVQQFVSVGKQHNRQFA